MSKGLGRIERVIQKQIEDDQKREMPVKIGSWRVIHDTFHPPDGNGDPEIYRANLRWSPTRAQKLTVVRAMHSFVRKFSEFGLLGGKGRHRLILYDRTDRWSVAWVLADLHKRTRRGGGVPLRHQRVIDIAETLISTELGWIVPGIIDKHAA